MTSPFVPEDMVQADSQPVALQLRCCRCGRKQTERFLWVTVDPETADGADGVTVSHIVTCKKCGAVDDYTVDPLVRIGLIGRAAFPGAGAPGSVFLARARLWDGSIRHRPTEILARLRELVQEQADRAEGHRRLGNACERFGKTDEAAQAWNRALELDPNDVEAAYSLAQHGWHRERDSGRALQFIQVALQALPDARRANPELGRFGPPLIETLEAALEYLDGDLALMAAWNSGMVRGQPVVSASSVDVRKIRDFKRLGTFIIRDDVIALALTNELPADEPTQLQLLLDGQEDFVRREATAAAREPMQPARGTRGPGRNEPCPCGSGRKYKRCCGG
ncbi:MAG: SEC-C metal-binding domain-containing protein [Myxococcota bacterium]